MNRPPVARRDACRMPLMGKQDGDRLLPTVYAWPGRVGWWHIPLIWGIVLFVASLTWIVR
jgi:hypothetical protein